jgi:hypothetical protein
MQMASENHEVDFAKLEELGEASFQGGGIAMVKKVRQIQAGEKVAWQTST